MSEANLRLKFRDYAIAARPARNAALISLAAELPAPVLADLLDLSTTAAVRWTARAKRDWTATSQHGLRIKGAAQSDERFRRHGRPSPQTRSGTGGWQRNVRWKSSKRVARWSPCSRPHFWRWLG
jgi:hypothetical protein